MNSFDTLLTAYSTLENAFNKIMEAHNCSKDALAKTREALDLTKRAADIYKQRCEDLLERSEELVDTFNQTLNNIQSSNLVIIRDTEVNPYDWCKDNCKHSFRIYEQYGLPSFALFSDTQDAVMFKLFLG